MIKTLILYQSRYGFTEMMAKSLSLILGPAKCSRTSDFKGNPSDFEAVVICAPVYSEAIEDTIIAYVSQNADWLQQKKIILICACLDESRADQYLEPLRNILGQSVKMQKAVGGELTIVKLNHDDYQLMKQFCDRTGFPFTDHNLFDKQKLVGLALHMKEIINEAERAMAEQDLRTYVDDFINSHNTCALATGHGETVRATPIEYTYLDGSLYVLTEGGEKFANILLNNNVSVCIYNAFTKMSELGGMQIAGMAEIVDMESIEYHAVLKRKGLPFDRISSLPITLNLIKINIQKIEFLWSGFSKLGYDTKQTLLISKDPPRNFLS